MALIPVAVSPHGTLGSLFQRFMHGEDAPPPSDYKTKRKIAVDRSNAIRAEQLTRSYNVPRNLLQRANDL
eukprot:CAMPEP_0183735064 /NCGR_PEP_ID=MMETSP0737-20130205/45556_1 /TAXON_ID=385413 /ORGANISM="Thalassiosira miniscula, Strain CCMP1093" /LENGTH=69 /DNA_ID=CAMNT_0025968711 /DNA_START=652 /DNA_END=858 /DNA_ORIENTATION=-